MSHSHRRLPAAVVALVALGVLTACAPGGTGTGGTGAAGPAPTGQAAEPSGEGPGAATGRRPAVDQPPGPASSAPGPTPSPESGDATPRERPGPGRDDASPDAAEPSGTPAEPSTPERHPAPGGGGQVPEQGQRQDQAASRDGEEPAALRYDPAVTTIHIGDWSRPVVRGGQPSVDRCEAAVLFDGPDPAEADGYEMDTSVIVGHDHCGFQHFATLAVGSEVLITGPAGVRRYEVYGHQVAPGQGGPNGGLYWGDVTLQACVGPDTGFSYLRQVTE